MADAYQLRKRLLQLQAADIRRIAEHPEVAGRWALRANVRQSEMERGVQRAVKGLKTAIAKDSTRIANDLAPFWNSLIVPQLDLLSNEADPISFGVRCATTLIGSAGSRALISSLAAGDYDVSAEMAERFEELSEIAARGLSNQETDELSHELTKLLSGDGGAMTEPATPITDADADVDADARAPDPDVRMTAQPDLNAATAGELIAELQERASRFVAALSAAAACVRTGKEAPDVSEELYAWNAARTTVWSALGGSLDLNDGSFDELEDLRQQIAEREAAATAVAAREAMKTTAAQLRQTIDSLAPMIADNESFRAAHEVASAQLAELEKRLAVSDGDEVRVTASDDIELPGEEGTTVIIEKSPGCVESIESAESATGTAGTQVDSVQSDQDADENDTDPCEPERVHEHRASASDGSEPKSEAAAPLDIAFALATDGSLPDAALPNQADVQEEYSDELTRHVRDGRFGAAWLVAWAAGLPAHEVTAYKLAATAFNSVPGGGIDPSEVLTRLTKELASSAPFSCQSARVALAAILRAALASGWSPRSELEAVAAQANLDEAGRGLVGAIVTASDRNYQHLHDAGGGGLSPDDVRARALGLGAGLKGMHIRFVRADKVLKYLLRDGEPIGSALAAVVADTSGEERRKALTAALVALESPDNVIAEADQVVSTPQQRRKPIESHALRGLRRAIEDASTCVGDALKSAVATGDDTLSTVAQDVRNGLIAAAKKGAHQEADSPGDAALARLRQWIVQPEPPTRMSNELQLLLDESLPVVSARRDDNGLPIINDDCAAQVVDELRSPKPWEDLFATYGQRGDLQEAVSVSRHAPELASRIPALRIDWKRRLERAVSAARADLARTYATSAMHGPRANDAQVEAEALLVAPGEYTGDRYDLQMAELGRIRDKLAHHRAEIAEHLQERARAEIVNDTDQGRVIDLIEDEDFVGATELLALAHRGPLPTNAADEIVSPELFDAFVEALSGVKVSTNPSTHDLVDAFAGASINEPTEPAEGVKTSLASWDDLVPRSRHRSSDRSGKLFAVLRGLGLDTRGTPARQTPPGVRHFELFRVAATPVDSSLVPGLGSQAPHYMVAVTADHKLIRQTLSSGFPVKNGPNIVLFDGVLTMDERRQCLNTCREAKISAIVIDRAIAAFVAVRHPRSFRAVQQLTLPFTCFSHYSVVAGNVPDEVFVGRADELAQLTDRTGSLFVYGGRQLGKSALLRKIQRDFNAVPDQQAIFIDLNSHGIGTWADPQQLWPVLHSELAKIDSMGIKAGSSVRNHDVVTKAIRQWLAGKASRRLLLLLDEADAFLEKESREAPNGFQNIGPLKGLFDDTEGRFKPVFAGLHKVQRLQNVANTPLAHGGRDVLIGPLAAKPARDLVVKPLEALGYRFENPEAIWRLLAFTNLQPGLIQIVCSDLIAHLQSRPLGKGEPLIAIRDTDIDYVTGNQTTRNKIAEKLRLTIALEDRYRVIALAVAIMSMEDNFREKYGATDIREHCRVYWPEGFQDLNSAEFEVYLDELVGLGVLTHDDKVFAVRSPNIVTMLGTKEELTIELDENVEQFELPHEYNPRSTRRQVLTSGKSAIRSPLTEHDLSQLIPRKAKYEARNYVVAGGESLGINDITSVLTQVGAERGVQVTLVDAAGDDVASILNGFRWAGGGTSAPRVVVVDAAQVDARRAEDAIAAANECLRMREHGHLITVLGPSGVDAAISYRDTWVGSGTKLIALKKWSGDGIRSRHDNPFNTPNDRTDLLRHSGGWPRLVEKAVIEAANTGDSYAEQWDRLSRFPENAEAAEAFLHRVGVGEVHQGLLVAWAELGSTTYESIEDIAAVLGYDIDDLRALAEHLSLLGAVDENQGEFLIDPVVARALAKL